MLIFIHMFILLFNIIIVKALANYPNMIISSSLHLSLQTFLQTRSIKQESIFLKYHVELLPWEKRQKRHLYQEVSQLPTCDMKLIDFYS